MGIQTQLDQYAIEKLPAINALLLKSEQFESNQMRTAAIRMMNKSLTIEEMTKSQIKKFENSLIQKFLYHGWIK